MATPFFLLLLVSVNLATGTDFSCPTNPILRESGTFPSDEKTLVTFPNNYNCEIKFQIEDGFVFRLTIVANVSVGSGDSLTVTDALGKQTTYTDDASLFVAAPKTASVKISTTSGNSQFWFRYTSEYVALNEQTKYPTGSRMDLRFLPLNKIYTFISPYNDQVVLNTATIDNINLVDVSLRYIYVYDGPDVKSPFVGNLYDYVTSTKLSRSSGNATTLINYYGQHTFSHALANDYKSITPYDTYTFVVYTTYVTIPKNFMDGVSNAYTFYCIRSDTSFLTDLNFGSNSFKADVRPLTPSDTNNVLLSYLSTDPVNLCMPQIIPGRIFTMVTLGPELSISLSTTADNWLTVYNGRLGYIFSASLWSPGALPAYNYTFESTQLMTFTFNFPSVIIHQAGEVINVKVGTPGSQPASVTFTHTVTNPGTRVANGTYLTASYIGNEPSSSSIISFQMKRADGTGPTNAPMTTATHIETTTKISNSYSLVIVFILIVLNLL
ncbi:Protein CBG11494 [Caenorhabditis briggsae]|uniref:Protein CBG11494 n=1 Tax=Caenorhabditis briggsae TaxID=6238 RepID=A8XCV6_CAEBR|nr:Protein CBG11494 [Caenorhabditis briggsae]CAP30474.2 Protein CBG11494 [Caenorhabditis briggsae]